MNKLSFQLVGLLCEKMPINEVINYLFYYCKLSKEDIAKFGFGKGEIEDSTIKAMNWNIF